MLKYSKLYIKINNFVASLSIVLCMNKFSSIDKVYGEGENEPEESRFLNLAKEQFLSHSDRELEHGEIEKDPRTLKAIDLINEYTDKIRASCGLPSFSVPSENIYIIKEEYWPNPGSSAVFDPERECIKVSQEDNFIMLVKRICHEIIHFKSYGAVKILQKDTRNVIQYRCGIEIQGASNQQTYFTLLNEAVTEELARRFILDLIEKNHILIKKEIKSMGIISSNLEADSPVYFSYEEERKKLYDLIDKLFDSNQDLFKNKEEVFFVFVRAMLTGYLVELAKLIEKTQGGGAFRRLAQETSYDYGTPRSHL